MIYDFGKIPSKKLIKPGLYDATIVKVDDSKTSKGDLQKRVVFEIETKEGTKTTISDFILQIEKVYWKIQQLLYACELKCEGKVRMSDGWSEVIGKKLRIKIDTQEYQGRENSRVMAYYRLGTGIEDPESE